MHKWRYQIIKRQTEDEPWFDLGGVYLDEEGNVIKWTEEASSPGSDTPEGIIKVLENMLKDAKSLPVFEEPEE